ncbi:MAG: hypothetical protein JNK72_18535 [Myxococcales bacterium]|nr:hypothetical protein [Myxococcales bacterium]
MSQGAPAKPRRKIRNYLIDPRFQLRYTAILVGASVILLTVLGAAVWRAGAVAANEARSAVDLATLASNQAERALRESQTANHALRLQRLAQAADDPSLARAIESELAQSDAVARENLREVGTQRDRAFAQRDRIDRDRLAFRRLLVGGGALFALVLAALGIIFTHRVVGPVYRFKQLFWKVGRGDLEITERLREGDELQDLFEAFVTMVASLRANQAREVAALEVVLKRFSKDGVEGAGVEELRKVITRMRAGLAPSEDDTRPSMLPGE